MNQPVDLPVDRDCGGTTLEPALSQNFRLELATTVPVEASASPSDHSQLETTTTDRAARLAAAVGLRWQLIESLDQWRPWAAAWDRLAGPQAMHGYDWMSAWWRHLGQHQGRLAVVLIQQDNEVIGAAPLLLTRSLAGSSLKFLGSGRTCTDYLDLLHLPGRAEAVATQVCQWLQSADFQTRFGRIDLLELEGHRPAAPGIAALNRHLKQAGWRSESQELESSWQVPFPTDWATYLATLSPRGRRRLRRAERWLEQGEVGLRFGTQPHEIADMWPRFVQLHQGRRQDKGQAGCFADSAFAEFLQEAVMALAKRQRAALVGLYQHEQAIAMGLVLSGPNSWQLYQTGMDADQLKWEPGHTINALLIRHAWKQGMSNFDFLRGDEPYKARWQAQAQSLQRTRIWNTHLASRLRWQVVTAGRQLQRWARSVRANFTKNRD